METYWRKSIEDGLRKERDPRIQRTIENVGTIPDDLFMRNHLDGLYENGKGRFSHIKTRKNVIQWRCERSTHQKGSSAGEPETTRANSCSAYVSFHFITSANIRGCVVREMHSGHDLTNRKESRMNRIDDDLVEFIHGCISQGLSNSAILLKCIDWSQSRGKTDFMDRTFFVSPEDITQIRASFNKYIRMDGNDSVSVEKLIQSELKDSILLFQPLSHSEDQPLMIVYSSTWQLEQLNKFGGQMFFLDATYKSITQYGFAFYAVMVKNEEGKGVPVSFFILSEETTSTLEACLKTLKEAADDVTPRCVMVDKDQTEIKAIKTVFLHTSVLLCWFHVLQAIHRWLVKKDGGHVHDPAVRNIIIQGVCSLKQCRTEKEFHQTASMVLKNIHKETGSDRVLNYLKDNWIQCGTMWSNFGRMFFHHQSETNNVVERFFFGIKYNFLGGYCNKRLDDLLLILHNHVVKYYCHLDDLKLAGRVPSQVSHPNDSAKAAERMRSHGLDQNVSHLSRGLFRVPSENKPGIFYEVDLLHCLCQCPINGQGQKCKHLALAQEVAKDKVDIVALRQQKAEALSATQQFLIDGNTIVVHYNDHVGIVFVSKQQCSCLTNSLGELYVCLLVANKVYESQTVRSEINDEIEHIHSDDTLPQLDSTDIAQPQHTDTAQPQHCIWKMLKDLSSWCDSESYNPSLALYNNIKAAHQLAFGRFQTQSKKSKIERLHKYRKAIELTKRKLASAHKCTNNPEKEIHTVNKDRTFKPKGTKRKRGRKLNSAQSGDT